MASTAIDRGMAPVRWVVMAALLALLAGCSAELEPYRSETVHTTRHTLRTDEGLRFFAYRYKPAAIRPGTRPVILCPGMANNALALDIRPDVSLPGYLAERGFDVWSLTLTGSTGCDRRRRNHDIDAFAMHDLPAAIEYVKQATGHDRIAWVGASMGGMTMVAHLVRNPRDDVMAFANVSGPVILQQPLHPIFRTVYDREFLVRLWLATLNVKGVSMFGRVVPGYESSLTHTFYNLDNVDPEVLRLGSCDVMENIPRAVYDQVRHMLRTGHFTGRGGSPDYAAQLHRIDVPMLMVTGALDRICSPAAARYFHNRVGSTDKTLHILGRATGYAADYGHADIVVARTARKDLFPILAQWLAERMGTATPRDH